MLFEKLLECFDDEELKLLKRKVDEALLKRAVGPNVVEVTMWQNGNKLMAIKAFRQRSGLSLLDSKRQFEKLSAYVVCPNEKCVMNNCWITVTAMSDPECRSCGRTLVPKS